MQAITTKYINPTNARGARIGARCAAGKVVAAYDHALSSEENHAAAARALAAKLGWTSPNYGELVSGCTEKGEYVHVTTKTVSALRALTGWACKGDDRNSGGNPYTRPAIVQALKAIAQHDGEPDYMNARI